MLWQQKLHYVQKKNVHILAFDSVIIYKAAAKIKKPVHAYTKKTHKNIFNKNFTVIPSWITYNALYGCSSFIHFFIFVNRFGSLLHKSTQQELPTSIKSYICSVLLPVNSEILTFSISFTRTSFPIKIYNLPK